MAKKHPNVINGEYTLSEWVRLFESGAFNNMYEMVDAGFFDWWCSGKSLFTRFKKMAPKVVQLTKSPLIDCEKTYVFFKNNCPMVGPLYDSFSICDIETGKVLYWVGHLERGCHGVNKSGWEVNADVDGEWREVLTYATWKDVKEYFQI